MDPGPPPEILAELEELRQLVEELKTERDAIQAKYDRARRGVLHYRENPGCNINAKKTAMRRLLWSVGEEF